MSESPEERATETILDSIADGVFTVDEDWRITSFNRAAEQTTSVSRDEAVGRPCCDVFRASICENECALKNTLRSGRPIVNKAIYVLDADGRRIPVSISAAALKDANGHTIGGVETFRDLSLVEELRKELEGKYTFADIVGRSSAMRQHFELLPQTADSNSTVLIVSKFSRLQSKDIAGVSEDALAVLMEHDYPGNVRELENVIEHAFVLCRGGLIEPHHLPSSIRGDTEINRLRGKSALTLRALEAMHIADAVRRQGGNRTAAARELGIDPSTLFRKIKSLNIELVMLTNDPQSSGT